VKPDVVPEESERWMTVIGVLGSETPGFSALISASFQVVIFVYFQSVIDDPACTSSIVGLDQLAPDLKTAGDTPSLSYIVPDRCHDGSEEPCAPGQPSGLAAADGFLSSIVPQIESSTAYKTRGLIVITFDQAPQSGPGADPSGCCMTSTFPNLPAGATRPTGASGTATGSTTTTGVPGTAAVTPGTATGPPGTATTTEPATGAPAGGGRVGLLLISKYVKPASINVTGEYDHFSLLASIENLFGLSHLGYAGAQGLLVFDTSVYNVRR
jgi:phosphatidylinositol-3-phosphatase